jgi:peptidyl-prolyl cis-trans isomerase B (cyclophilin B)
MSNPQVELHIADHGVITIELDADKAPKSTENFLAYVNKGHYNNTIFHRIIDGFMIQGGGFEPGMKQKDTDAPIENEAKNVLNHTSPSAQGWGYAVFGKVIKGTEIVDKLRGVKTGRSGFHQDVPKDDVIIEKAVAL